MTNSIKLRQRLQFTVPALLNASNKIFSSNKFVTIYPEYLLTMHFVIRASVGLMRVAADACLLKPGDPVYAKLRKYYLHHCKEEKNHDLWLLDDLTHFGYDASEILSMKPPVEVATLVGQQYYYAIHHDPLMLLGYIAVLEGFPPQEEMLLRLQQNSGLPLSSFRTLIKHSQIDVYHKGDLDLFIDRLELSPSQMNGILVNAITTIDNCSAVLNNVPAQKFLKKKPFLSCV